MKITESISIMKALGDSSRLLIVNSLLDKPQYLEELAQRLNLAVSTVSFHMKKLENAGLVNKKKEQYYVVFYINEKVFDSTIKDIISFDNIDRLRQDERIRQYRNKVIGTYFQGGKLLKIPSQHKKRLIILEEIIKLFEPGRVYQEKEVDARIEEVNYDYCSIRRYFIDENMMLRQQGKYWIRPGYENNLQTGEPAFSKNAAENNSKKEKKMDTAKRKEIIKNYKQAPTPMGVYQIKNLKNGKILIGSTKNLYARKNREIMMFKMKGHEIQELQEAWDEMGENGVSFEVIDTLEPKKDEPNYDYRKDLETLEELWLDKLQPYGEKGYNEIKKKKESK